MVLIHISRWYLNKLFIELITEAPPQNPWVPQNTIYKTRALSTAPWKMESRCLDTSLQWQGSHLSARQPVSQFSLLDFTRCQICFGKLWLKRTSSGLWNRCPPLRGRSQLLHLHLGLPFSCPNVPHSLNDPSYAVVLDFLITSLWAFSCFLEQEICTLDV